jgi:para-nitrobenzyl esterase
VIPNDQYKLYEAGKYNDVAILVGYNSDEGLSFSREKTPEQFRSNVEKRYGPVRRKTPCRVPSWNQLSS